MDIVGRGEAGATDAFNDFLGRSGFLRKRWTDSKLWESMSHDEVLAITLLASPFKSAKMTNPESESESARPYFSPIPSIHPSICARSFLLFLPRSVRSFWRPGK